MILKKLTIIDWYDGVCVGLGSVDEKFYTISLIARDFKTNYEIYYFLEIKNPTEYSDLINLLQNEEKKEKWILINKLLTKIHIKNNQGYLEKLTNLKEGISLTFSKKIELKINFPFETNKIYEMTIDEKEKWFSL